jgi:hypothetical protein
MKLNALSPPGDYGRRLEKKRRELALAKKKHTNAREYDRGAAGEFLIARSFSPYSAL